MIHFLFIVLVAADPPREATITVTLQCPACEPCRQCPPVALPTDRDFVQFSYCMTGPKRVIEPGFGGTVMIRPTDAPDDSGLWGYRTLDENHQWAGWDVYWLVCPRFDRDHDGDVDLADLSALMQSTPAPSNRSSRSRASSTVVVAAAPDCSTHGFVLRSYAKLYLCLSGPGVPYINETCGEFEDFTDQAPDGDIDLDDVAAFMLGVRP